MQACLSAWHRLLITALVPAAAELSEAASLHNLVAAALALSWPKPNCCCLQGDRQQWVPLYLSLYEAFLLQHCLGCLTVHRQLGDGSLEAQSDEVGFCPLFRGQGCLTVHLPKEGGLLDALSDEVKLCLLDACAGKSGCLLCS